MKRWLLIFAPLVTAGCAATPLGYLDHSGSKSSALLLQLGWGLLIISILVIVIIATLIIAATMRSRRFGRNDPSDVIGKDTAGLSAIYWGVGLSIPVLAGMAAWTFLSVQAIATPPVTPGLAVKVVGHRWWWAFQYQSPSQPVGIVDTANELVIPTGVPVRLDLESDDVIHDFWVPKLGPKMDMIPGRTNHSWIEADEAGTYRGQCAEFCGVEHGRMGFIVRAVSPADFRAWLARQRRPASANGPGREIFESKCLACHTVRGSTAAGIYGPDLTHFGSRSTIAAAMMDNTPDNLDRWLADTQGIKPGAQMPQTSLDPRERRQLVDWLESLR